MKHWTSPFTHGQALALGLLAILLLQSCDDPEVLAPPLDGVSDIQVFDNGNSGNGSDFEVNFTKESVTANIAEYRVFFVKSGEPDLSLEEANGIPLERYTSAHPDDIFPISGVRLSTDAKDTNGDLITGADSYTVGVLSVSADPKGASNALILHDSEVQLTLNNLILDFTQEMDAGAGSLALSASGDLFMGSYDIHAHLGDWQDEAFPVYKISPTGSVSIYSDPYRLLGGNVIDGNGNLYQSILFSNEVLVFDPGGSVETILLEDIVPRFPDGVFVDANNNVFIIDKNTGRIFQVVNGNSPEFFASAGPDARGITGDAEGNLYISHNRQDGQISKITPAGEASTLGNVPTLLPEGYTLEFLMWVGYLTYYEDFLYIAGMSTHRIYKMSLTGGVEVFAGSGERGIPRGGAITADLNRPIGLVFSEDGSRLFVSGCTDVTPSHTQYTRPAKVWEILLVE